MTKRAILNATSRKKKDTMLAVSNTAINGQSQTVAVSPAYVIGTGGGRFLYCPTARDLTNGAGNLGSIAQQAVRTSTACYMRGLAENLRIQTSSGIPWFHRRICFTNKGPAPFVIRATADPGPTPNPSVPFYDGPQGMQRLWLNMSLNNMPNTINEREGVIFKGSQGLDWNDPIVAPLDTSRITVKYDKTWTIKSGNERGTVFERKLWHPMNKTLVYDDDEAGDTESTSFLSTDSKAGMGDYYVYDIIQPGTGAVASDVILIQSNSTLYWHEK